MKKRINITYLIMVSLLIIILSAYYKIPNKINYLFEKVNKSVYSSTNQLKANILLDSYESFSKPVDIKESFASNDSEITIYPGGQPIGVKLNTKGVLVVALSDIENVNGKSPSPAANAGVQIGDSIIKINDVEINNAEDVTRIINQNIKTEITLKMQRKNEDDIFEVKVEPTLDSTDGKKKIGLWVRDSTAGVGTLSFYHEKSNKFGALGHPITDADTGTILSVNNGVIISSNIVSIKKGTKGNPGELRGLFIEENKIKGQIIKNTQCGVFGNGTKSLINEKFNKPMNIAFKNEIKIGKAEILTTINNNKPELFDIEIQKLLPQDTPGSKSMIIKITDPRLLEKTGGIVQGMSGSPIIQNNKIIGAVTHVLINKPDTGYGIYIEWMLKDAEILSK